jgi:hypothetical protein
MMMQLTLHGWRMKLRVLLGKKLLHIMGKKNIVLEAYAEHGIIKCTARKYNIQANQIRKWRNNANALVELPAYPNACMVDEQSVIKAAKDNVTVHKGRASSIPNQEVNYIMDFYHPLWEHGMPVSAQVLAIELQRVSPQLNHVAIAAIRHRVLRIMKKKTLLTAVLLIRPKTSTMSSIS